MDDTYWLEKLDVLPIKIQEKKRLEAAWRRLSAPEGSL
jgi:hypothetical protein